MGNICAKCCHSEYPDYLDGIGNKDGERTLTSDANRVPSSLPSLLSRRDKGTRVVRIESFSPIIEVEDHYESSSAEEPPPDTSEIDSLMDPELSDLILAAGTPPNRSFTSSGLSHYSPKPASQLRLLLSTAPPLLCEDEIECKEDEEDPPIRVLKRVERHGSLHTVLPKEDEDIQYASAPIAALKDSDLPQGLVFAFLDDSAVARTCFEHTLKKLHGSDQSFVRGATLAEAASFPEEVLANKPDIVVLDNCLDYGTDSGETISLKGTNLARTIRENGFEGCIIIQSSQDSLKREIDFDIVDGMTNRQQKGPSAFAIARMVAIARRKNKLTGLASSQSSLNSREEPSFSFDFDEKMYVE